MVRGAQGEGGTGRGGGGIDPKIAARNNPCDYAVIAVGLASMMEELENLETRRVIRHRSEVGVCVISNYAVITELRSEGAVVRVGQYKWSYGKHTSVMYVLCVNFCRTPAEGPT